MNDTSSKEVVLINVFTPKSGKSEEFARAQIEDFERLGSQLDGAYANRLYMSLNNADQPKVINVAHFESLEVFYRTTASSEFKAHIEKIKPLLEDGEPMICQLLWQSEAPDQNQVEGIFRGVFPQRVAENQRYVDEMGKRDLRESA